MSCSSSSMALVTKDFMGTQDSDDFEVSPFDLDKKMEPVSDKGCPKTDLKLAKAMPAIDMFRKYLLDRAQHSNSIHEPEMAKRSPPRALLPPKLGSNLPRPISLLERGLLPGGSIRYGSESTHDKPQAAQLTIFYAGAVNVFDDITMEKAKSIMLLAGDPAFVTPLVTKSPKPVQATTPNHTNLPSICKLQAADLPIARKRSIKSFLEKRRDRIIHKSPYRGVASGKEHVDQDDEARRDGGSNTTDQIFHPSPFPSRLGFFFSVPTKGHC